MNNIEKKIKNSKLMFCRHNEMLIHLIDLLIDLKRLNLLSDDFSIVASQVVEIIANERCKKEELRDSYKYFILNKIKIAFQTASLVHISVSEESEDVLDIPIDEFEDAFVDHDFLKLVGYDE